MAGEHSLPGLGLKAGWTSGSAGYGADIETNFRIVSALLQGNVVSRTTALPASGVTGDVYLVRTGDTDAEKVAIWDTHDDAAATWIYITPEEGWILYVLDSAEHVSFNGTNWITFGNESAPYDIRVAFIDTPADGAVIDKIHVVREFTLPANMVGSLGSVTVNPTATYTIDVKDDGVTIGVISITSGGVLTFTTTGGIDQTIAAASILTFVSQATADATVEGASITLKGSV